MIPSSPSVMGVLNLGTENLQADDKHSLVEKALLSAEQMLADGAAIIDVSCGLLRNELETLSVNQELDLIIPVIEIISKRISIPISVDTSNPEVMQAAVQAGAKMINDIRALTKLSALATAVQLNTEVCLMHMQNDPVTKHVNAQDKDIVSIVYQYLEQRIAACVTAGMDPKRIIIDPGFGYGKSLPQNLNLLRSLHRFKNLNCPILVDLAHKSMLGQILDVSVEGRTYGGIAAEVIAVSRGADIIRSHDVRATVDAIKVYTAIAG